MTIPILIVGLIVASLVGLAWWLLITTEGVYLGQRVVTWLYDLYATRYDGIKQVEPEYDDILLAQPLMNEIVPKTNPLVLDVATGTGRLPAALCRLPYFDGHIIACDPSRKMLAQAIGKLADEQERVHFLRCPAENLPFAAATFDVVTCLEALEFTTKPAIALRECIRVLKPGGLLLITNRRNVRMPGRLWSDDELHTLLGEYGIVFSQTEPWQEDYHKVWGVKYQENA
jgi:ubiquinone/menaquinone biosynthesis C-methylase UbiE